MLARLLIRNFALVESTVLDLKEGFNVLTGETGAGKSMLVDALTFLLGDRMSADSLRTGEDRALVEAIFQLEPGSAAMARLTEWGIPVPGGELLVKREFTRSAGRTRSTVNGEMATAAMVAELGDLLVDIHGQHEHQAIFNVGRHRRLVDAFGHLDPLLERTAARCSALGALLEERSRLGGDAKDIARRADLLAFQRNELEAAGVEGLDEEGLKREYLRLKNAEKTAGLLSGAAALLNPDEGEEGVSGRAGKAAGLLSEAARTDPGLEALAVELRELQSSAARISSEMVRRAEGCVFDEERFREVAQRMDLLNTLKKKYGNTLEEVRRYLRDVRQELATLSRREERLKELGREVSAASDAYAREAAALSGAREKAGNRLSAEVQTVLRDLGLPDARLAASVAPQEEAGSPVERDGVPMALSEQGWDRVEFTFSANPGEPLRPLQKTASGGEASRVMLALKAVLAGSDETPTLIFDEIDTGVGGRTAPAVGALLERLANGKQVVCISHLAPIASRGESHLRVVKTQAGSRTMVGIERLEGKSRLEELARMMSGDVSETSLRHAREMYEKVRAKPG
jgi:DNA repair protein RecN (Recombination protein N)